MSDGATFAIEAPPAMLEVIARRAAEIVMNDRRFLSREALAHHLGISDRRIKTLRERGLPARKVGRDLYFNLEEVYEWIDRHG